MSNWWDADPLASGQASGPDFAGAISSIESGGNYRAIGPQTGKGRALGKYQVMEYNVGPWSESVLGRRLTPEQFLADDKAQDQIFEGIFGNYVKKYGPEGAAKAWFAGERGMNNPNAKDALGTTVASYAEKFSNRAGNVAASAQARNWWDADPVTGGEQSQPEPQMVATPEATSMPPPAARITVGSRPTIGPGRAFAEGLRSGATANFGDELAGVAAAAGTPEGLRSPLSGPSDAILGAIKLGYGALTGDDSASKRYAAGRDEVRETQKAAEEQQFGMNLAGQLGGAIALPMGGMLNAATLPARMARGAAVGAGYGGVSGAGAGTTVEDRAAKAAIGTGIGGVFGGIGVPAVEGITRGISAAVSRPAAYLRGAMNPTASAERAIGRAYREATEADPNAINRLAPNELRPGAPQTVMDTLGQPGRDLARSAANISGGARDRLNQTLDERYQNQAGRLTGWLRQTFHYPNAHAQQQAIDQTERTVNRAAYARAYQAGDRPVWSPELERLVGAPAVQDAMRAAVTTGKDRAVNQGFGGFNVPFTVTPDGRLVLNRGPSGQPTFPNLQFWDYVRREVSNAASKAERSGAREDASRLGDLSRSLNRELDNLVPAYREARQGAAAFFGAENALEAGQIFVTQNFAAQQTRAALARMTPNERQLFQDGFVSRLVETLENIPDRADVVRRIYNSEAAREKIQIALGRQRANELEAMLRIENVMQASLRAVQGNSTTALQIMTGGLAGAAGGGFMGFDPTTSGLAAALATAGKRGIDTRVANQIAEMLTSRDPAVLNRGIRMVAGSQRYMDALRSADAATARIGGNQASSVPLGSQVPAITRAEDEPKVPRPPGQ